MKPVRPSAGTLVTGLAVVGLLAVVSGVLLTKLSRPVGFDERLAALTARTALAERLVRHNAVAGPLAPRGACASGPAGQLQALKDELAANATRLDLQPTMVDARIAPAGLTPGVTAIALKFEVVGSYAGAMGLLDTLSRRNPAIFAETVDLVSRTSSVSLSFVGRVLCVA